MSVEHYIHLMKGKSLTGIMKGVVNVITHKWKQFLLFIRPVSTRGISGRTEIEYVVSLTSFPARINCVYYCVKSILNQSLKADAVILWLAEEQFPNKESDLPLKLLNLRKHGLTINWCSDMRSYKKILPTLKLFPQANIITTDDDVYYSTKWLSGLIEAFKKDPTKVYCYRAAKIKFEPNFERENPQKGVCYPRATYLHQQTGVGGVLYPQGCFHKDINRLDLINKFAPTNDDLWLWFMVIKNNYKIDVLNENNFELFYIGDSQDVSLTSINDHGEKLYDSQLKQLFNLYPDVLDTLRDEQKEWRKKYK